MRVVPVGRAAGKDSLHQSLGFILSGGPKSVYEENAPFIQDFIFKSGLPILESRYGMQALTHAPAGKLTHPLNASMGRRTLVM
ncbi:MAG: hypothetical protein U0X92_06270 [Anaerolineales bacterium]